MMLTCKLGAVRKERGLSQGELAKRVGVTTSYISKIERAERDPAVALALRIAVAIDATVNQLWAVKVDD